MTLPSVGVLFEDKDDWLDVAITEGVISSLLIALCWLEDVEESIVDHFRN